MGTRQSHRTVRTATAGAVGQGLLLLQKGRVISGKYGRWEVPSEHDGEEVWVVAGPPRQRLYRDRRGAIDRGPVYLREDGAVARAEYLELLPQFKLIRPV